MRRWTVILLGFVLGMTLSFGSLCHAASDLEICKSQKLNASALYMKKALFCYRQAVTNLSYEPDPICMDEATTQFLTRWDDAEASAAEKGEDCTITEPSETLVEIATFQEETPGYVYAIVAEILGGPDGSIDGVDDVDLNDKQARKLAASLLKSAGLLSFDLLKAYSKDLKKPNEGKLAKRERKAESRFQKSWGKNVRKAEKKGHRNGKVPLGDVQTLVEDMVEDVANYIDVPEQTS